MWDVIACSWYPYPKGQQKLSDGTRLGCMGSCGQFVSLLGAWMYLLPNTHFNTAFIVRKTVNMPSLEFVELVSFLMKAVCGHVWGASITTAMQGIPWLVNNTHLLKVSHDCPKIMMFFCALFNTGLVFIISNGELSKWVNTSVLEVGCLALLTAMHGTTEAIPS